MTQLYKPGMNGLWLSTRDKKLPDLIWYPIPNLVEFPMEDHIEFTLNDVVWGATRTGRTRDRSERRIREYGYIWEARVKEKESSTSETA